MRNALLALTLTPRDAGLLALVGVLAFLGGLGVMAWLKREKAELTKTKRSALDLATFFTELNLPNTADFFKAFAIDDFSGMWEDARQVLKIVKDEELRAVTVRRMMFTCIAKLKAAGDDAAVKELQDALAGTVQQVVEAESKLPSAADMQALIGVFNAGKSSGQSAGEQANKVATAAPV